MLPVNFYIGIYTYCGFESKEIEFSDVPLLLISGKQDKITPASYCRNFAKNVKKNTEYYELKYANHSFDNYTFYFGGYLPWQPYLKSNNNEVIIKTETNPEGTYLWYENNYYSYGVQRLKKNKRVFFISNFEIN